MYKDPSSHLDLCRSQYSPVPEKNNCHEHAETDSRNSKGITLWAVSTRKSRMGLQAPGMLDNLNYLDYFLPKRIS